MNFRKTAISAVLLAAALLLGCAGCEGAESAPAWGEARKASCWFGPGASHRAMNVLSPHMPEEVFQERVREMAERGVDSAHVFLVNQKDGEYAGYSPWGAGGPSAGPCDEEAAAAMRRRISRLRGRGWAVAVWIVADDSAAWANRLAANADACLRAIDEAGLLDEASIVVLGLEMDEYWGARQARAVADAVRGVWPGATGTHHTGLRADFAALGDILFYQADGVRTADEVRAHAAAAMRHGRKVNFFELADGPNRLLAQAALDAGCCGVGNW